MMSPELGPSMTMLEILGIHLMIKRSSVTPSCDFFNTSATITNSILHTDAGLHASSDLCGCTVDRAGEQRGL